MYSATATPTTTTRTLRLRIAVVDLVPGGQPVVVTPGPGSSCRCSRHEPEEPHDRWGTPGPAATGRSGRSGGTAPRGTAARGRGPTTAPRRHPDARSRA